MITILRILLNSAPIRFILAGALNTTSTYGLYLFLIHVTDYRLAYSISYIIGIAFAYILNIKFVFRAQGTLWKASLYPLIYLIQYSVGLGLLSIAVNKLFIAEKWAIFAAILGNIPLGYILNKILLQGISGQRLRN